MTSKDAPEISRENASGGAETAVLAAISSAPGGHYDII